MAGTRARAARRAMARAAGAGLALMALAGCSRPAREPSAAFRAARSRAAPAEREWRSYLGDAGSRQYAPLRQIHRGNVGELEAAWEYAAGGVPEAGGTQIQCNPLVVRGVLYGTTPDLRAFALDASTGEELWTFASGQRQGLGLAPSRGLAWWSDRAGDERIFFGAGPYVFALDARTGAPVTGFGDGGSIDLRDGLRDEGPRDMVVATTPGVVVGDLLIQGGRVSELANAMPGDVRAFDVRTGALRWTFHTIPRPGEPGYETWPPDAWRRTGGANSWAGISVDAARGLAFVPTGSATYDFYGAARLGDDLYANTLLALDVKTGERRWHYQVVRHDVWDRDLPAPPNLVTIERDGRRIDAVAQITKTGHVFVFDRDSGEPLFPIEEVPVPGGALPGDVLAATQPLPVKPPPFARQRMDESLATPRTPEAHRAVVERLGASAGSEPFTPPSLDGTVLLPGMDGGGEWGGAAWDPETGLLYVNANDVPYWLQMVETPDVRGAGGIGRATYITSCAMCHGLDRRGDGASIPSLVGLDQRLGLWDTLAIVRDGRGRMSGLGGVLPLAAQLTVVWYLHHPDDTDATPPPPRAADAPPELGLFLRYMNAGWAKFLDPGGYPAIAPPWGTLTAIDLSRGEQVWQVPLGDHPELAASGMHHTGTQNYGGPVVTAGGLVFIAASADAKMHAFDKATGELLWQADLPAAGFATPAVYEADGREFVVVAAGGGKLGRPSGDRYVAFALPRERPAAARP